MLVSVPARRALPPVARVTVPKLPVVLVPSNWRMPEFWAVRVPRLAKLPRTVTLVPAPEEVIDPAGELVDVAPAAVVPRVRAPAVAEIVPELVKLTLP